VVRSRRGLSGSNLAVLVQLSDIAAIDSFKLMQGPSKYH
jgi:hypothetical protein